MKLLPIRAAIEALNARSSEPPSPEQLKAMDREVVEALREIVGRKQRNAA